ncbi:MAG: flagellar basal body-associated FliL family protein [Thermaerobacter sp.]|nr:hypothetical protein [Bacillota bacterium]REJ37124.1 MAG: hypothetical protein DIU84_04935 [Bacillota bacterium]
MSDAGNQNGTRRRAVRHLLLALAVFLTAGGGAAAGYWVGQGAFEAAPVVAREPAARQPGPVFSLGSLTTNLNDEGRPRFIQVSVQLEAADQLTLTELTAREGAVRDAALRTLRASTAEELQGADGMATLAQRLLAAVNQVLDRGEVLQVYFQEFVVQ